MFKQIIYFSISTVFTGKNILVTGSIIKIFIWKDDYWEKKDGTKATVYVFNSHFLNCRFYMINQFKELKLGVELLYWQPVINVNAKIAVSCKVYLVMNVDAHSFERVS